MKTILAVLAILVWAGACGPGGHSGSTSGGGGSVAGTTGSGVGGGYVQPDPCPVYDCPGTGGGQFRACDEGNDVYRNAIPPGPLGVVCYHVENPSMHDCSEQEAIDPAGPGKIWVPWCSACGRPDLHERAAKGEVIPDSDWLPQSPYECVPYPMVSADAGSGAFDLGCCRVTKVGAPNALPRIVTSTPCS